MTHAAPNLLDLPKDAEALRALMLAMQAMHDVAVAERDAIAAAHEHLQVAHDALAARAERLEHLLRTLRRLQFGARSERLPETQLQLGREDTETAIAKVRAEAERDDPALCREHVAKRRANRDKLPAPSAAHRCGAGAPGHGLTVLPGDNGGYWRGPLVAARHHPDAVPRAGNPAPEAGLPRLPGRDGAAGRPIAAH